MIFEATRIDPALYHNVRFCLKLQIALPGVRTVIVFECPLDVDRVCVMPLDQVAVVTVHGAHQVGQGMLDIFWQTPPVCAAQDPGLFAAAARARVVAANFQVVANIGGTSLLALLKEMPEQTVYGWFD